MSENHKCAPPDDLRNRCDASLSATAPPRHSVEQGTDIAQHRYKHRPTLHDKEEKTHGQVTMCWKGEPRTRNAVHVSPGVVGGTFPLVCTSHAHTPLQRRQAQRTNPPPSLGSDPAMAQCEHVPAQGGVSHRVFCPAEQPSEMDSSHRAGHTPQHSPPMHRQRLHQMQQQAQHHARHHRHRAWQHQAPTCCVRRGRV